MPICISACLTDANPQLGLFYGLDAFFHFVPTQTVSEPAGKFITALIDSSCLWTLIETTTLYLEEM